MVFSTGTKGRTVRREDPGFGVRKLECYFDNNNDNNEHNSDQDSGKGAPVHHRPGTQCEELSLCISSSERLSNLPTVT